MPYIGKSPTGSGVRQRYHFTATGGETSLSGADDNSKTLKFTDGEYVDVYLNGILLVQGTDYGVGTANTISSLAALSSGDIVEVVVYDIFNVAKINSEAIRARHYYTATGGETSIGTAQIGGLSFAANADIDVSLNGISLVAGTDYNTTTANTVGGLSALSAGNVIEIVIYEKFQLADTVSKASGGTFNGPVAMAGDLTVATDTLYVDSTNNRVGIGTTSPVTALEIQTTNKLGSTFTGTSNGEGLTVTQSNYTAGNYVSLIEAAYDDIGNASPNVRIGAQFNADGSSLAFGTSSSYASGITNTAMSIDRNGNVLVGTTTAAGTFDGTGTEIQPGTIYLNTTGVPLELNQTSNDTVARSMIRFFRRETQEGSITSSGSGTAYNTTSDYRLKENVTADWDATTRLKQLNPVRFNFIANADTTVDGFLAHEVQSVVPEAITGTHNEVETWTQDEIDAGDAPANTSAGDNKLDDDGNTIPVYQQIDQSKLVPLLVKTIQELEARITALENA